jgi:hypothetical protein
MVAGAIVVLAGAVLWGTGVVAMTGPGGWDIGNTAGIAGFVVGLIGFGILLSGLFVDRQQPSRKSD